MLLVMPASQVQVLAATFLIHLPDNAPAVRQSGAQVPELLAHRLQWV